MNEGRNRQSSLTEDRPSEALRVFLSLSHLANVCWRSFPYILIASIIFSSITAFYALNNPLYYTVAATFHDDEVKESDLGFKMGALNLDASEAKRSSRALALMRSRKVLEPLAHELHLQAVLKPAREGYASFWKSLWDRHCSRMQSNWRAEKAYMSDIEEPVAPDRSMLLQCQDILYEGEFKRQFRIYFTGAKKYQLERLDGSVLGTGLIGQAFSWRDIHFTLKAKEKGGDWRGEAYKLTLFPMAAVVDNVSKKVRIRADKDDERILYLSLSGGDRILSAKVLNGVMQGYVDYLRRELRENIQTKIDFLKKRQNKLVEGLEQALVQKAQDLGETGDLEGLLDYQSHLKLVTMRKEKISKQLTETQMQLELLAAYEQGGEEGVTALFRVLPALGNLHNKLQTIEKRRDSLAQEQQALIQPDGNTHRALAVQGAEMTQLPRLFYQQEPKGVVERYKQKGQLAHLSLFNHGSDCLWHTRHHLMQQNQWRPFSGDRKQLVHNLSCLATSTFNDQDFSTGLLKQEIIVKGLDIHTATQMYATYTRAWDAAQKQVKAYRLANDRLKNPRFSISSLSGELTDRVSDRLINQANEIRSKLGDKTYFAIKERQRYRKQLRDKRIILHKHLRQKLFMLNQSADLYQRQIQALLGHMIALLDHEVAAAREQIDQTVLSQRSALEQQLGLLQKELAKVKKPLSKMPEKWAEEQEFTMRTKMEVERVTALTKVVEALSISQDVDGGHSKTIDAAVPPVLPHPPHIIKRTFYGALWGAALAFAWFVLYGLARGFQANAVNLQLAGCTVAGRLFEKMGIVTKFNQGTLRRAISLIMGEARLSKALLVNTGGYGNYIEDLAGILSRKGDRVLIIATPHRDAEEPELKDGLFSYLQGNCEQPLIRSKGPFDELPFGGEGEYLSDLIGSQRFKQLLEKMEERYDWVLVAHHGNLHGVDAECLLLEFNQVLVTVGEESYQDLRMYIDHHEDPEEHKQVFFVMAQ